MTGTLLWGLWRRGRWHLVLLSSGLALFAALILSVVPVDDIESRSRLGFVLTWIATICLAVDLLHLAEGKGGEGFDTRLFIFPVSTLRLSATWLVALCGVMVLIYATGATAAGLWLGSPGPHLGAALFVAAATSWCICLLWMTPSRRVQRIVVSMLFGLGLLVALLAGPAVRSGNPAAMLDLLGPRQMVVLTVLLIAAFPAGTWAVGRHRRGDAAVDPTVHRRGFSRLTSGPPPEYPFGSSFSALFWLDWREKGIIVPALFGVPWILMLAALGLGLLEEKEIVAFVAAQINFAGWLAPAIAAGTVCRLHNGIIGSGLDGLRVLRPISSSRLAAVFLGHGALALTFAWVLTAVGTGALVAIAGEVPVSGAGSVLFARLAEVSTAELLTRLVTVALVVAIAGWLQIGGLTVLLLTGRNTTVALLIAVPYGVGGALLVFRDSLSSLPLEALMAWGPWLVGGMGVVATATAFLLALSKGLVRPIAVLPQIAGLALVAILGYLFIDRPGTARSFALLGIAVACLAPWPAASLALRWNRHR